MNFKTRITTAAVFAAAALLSVANSTAAWAGGTGHAWNDSPSTNQCLAAAGNQNDTTVIMWYCDSEAGQQWSYSPGWNKNPNGYWYKISNGNGSCLTYNPLAGNLTASTCIPATASDEEWQPYSFYGGLTEWQNHTTGLCLSVAGGSISNGATPILWKCQGTLDQYWGGSLA